MGLFTQDITLKMSDGKYIIEKVSLPPLAKEKINITVAPGTIAVIGSLKCKGSTLPYPITRSMIGSKKGETEAYLFPDKQFDSITVSFFGGQHMVSLSALPAAKAKFAIVGSATIEVNDYKDIANYIGCSITRAEFEDKIKKAVQTHLNDEVNAAASSFITPQTTEVTLRAALNNVAQQVMTSKKTASLLANMGLILSAKGITMHLNSLNDADEKMDEITKALAQKAIDGLNNDIIEREDRERDKDRAHEIDVIRAGNTRITENTDTRNINTNGNGHVVINDGSSQKEAPAKKKRFCPECGAEVDHSAKFCSSCGKRLN